ncbi:MAG TPA: gephyrin-like molybdotransferase Glp [Candidatus Angelobacter sp.]|nr:gephyrin-like molybdotransferase Glp [Candidatus Angelobacter sp.]
MSVLPFEQAYEAVQRYCQKLTPTGHESVSLLEAPGRVLAEPVLADRDFPPFPRSARDGYAIHASDVKTVPAQLRVVGQVKAGGSYEKIVARGEAVEIMTGAAVPEGANAVVMVEHTKCNGEHLEVLRSLTEGENIVPRGSEARAGQEIIRLGTRIGFAQIAITAAVGRTRPSVYKKPRVAILATGDELVDVAALPSAHQIRNSNTYSLAAQVIIAGGNPVLLPVAPDDKAALNQLIQEGFSSDLLLLSGGVSMGKFDLVEEVLTDLGASFIFTGVQIQPGRPVVFGEVRSTPFFGLPGNPVSTMVTFDLFARPVLQALGGAFPVRLPTVKARLGKDFKTKTGLTRFLPALLRGGLYDPEVETIGWQGSGDASAAARADCYMIIPPDRESIGAGETVSVLLRPS